MNVSMDLNPDLSENVEYNYPDFFAYIRKDYLSQYPNYASLSHWHDDIEMIAVLSGEMSYSINGIHVTLKKGEGLFINARQLHYGFSETKCECEFICVRLHPMLLCLTSQIEKDYIIPVLMNESFSYWILHPAVNWERNLINNIKKLYFELDKSVPQLHIQSIFCQIWIDLYGNAPDLQQSYKNSSQLCCVKAMIQYIQKHYQEKVRLEDIALMGSVCKSKCNSLFRQYLNQTPITYLIKFRLQKSIELMASTNMNITEISYEVGFSGTSYYVESFRKHFGHSPLEYRTEYILK